jgi:predicted NUDIX family phosphoesterase
MEKYALCIEREVFDAANERLSADLSVRLVDRSLCETDKSLLQIIPYLILQDYKTGLVFQYTRGKAGQEKKLHAKCSIGLGGHVEQMPCLIKDLFDVLVEGAVRELTEEVGYQWSDEEKKTLALKMRFSDYVLINLHDSDNPVDHVHLGIAIIIQCDRSRFTSLEDGVILNPKWIAPHVLMTRVNRADCQLESWSKFYIQNHSYLLSDSLGSSGGK